MRLKEFDLDLPYICDEKNVASIVAQRRCERNEATTVDYQMNWNDKRFRFSLETRSIASFFSRLFGYINTKDCWKILVDCVPEIFEERILNFSGVYAVQIQFDYDSFAKLSDINKKKVTLELLMSGIKKVALDQSWDMSPFENTYSKIIEADYVNEWIWKKPVKSPNRKNVASVFLQHEVNEIDISIIVSDIKGVEILRKKVITELPDEWMYSQHLGEVKWINDEKVVIINKAGDNEWQVCLN